MATYILGIGVMVAALVVGSAAPARAQSLDGDGPNQEGRNAYQEGCFIQSGQFPQECRLPAPAAGKRLAIRWLTVACNSVNGRVESLTLFARLTTSQTDSSLVGGILFKPVSISNTHGSSNQFVSEPVYAHSDVAPIVLASASLNFDSSCRVQVRGFLVGKP
jgi:hypothetical protein